MNTFFLLFSYTQPLGFETIKLNPAPDLTLTREEETWYELELNEEDIY